jgi:ADP-ribose pyrophosphatase YjhB (NUDIX family)
VFKKDKDDTMKYLMICRKDSLGYVDFIRGKYKTHDLTYIRNIINEMTINEMDKVRKMDFDLLWKDLWSENIGIQYRGEERISRDKFKRLTNGIMSNNQYYTIETLINESTSKWDVPEWGFPKGRRNYQEKDITCAIREFEEETGYSSSSIKLIQNLQPFDEIFTGSNYKSYKHSYYVAYMSDDDGVGSDYQKTEVSQVKWVTYDEAMNMIRPYNLEKKEVLTRANELLKNYRICV